VSFRLTRALLEAHGLAAVPPERERDAVLRSVDQVLLGADEAPLVVALLERAGVATLRVRTVLAEGGRGESPVGGPGRDWRRAALERGMLLSRPGHGAIGVLQREHLAVPGQMLLHAGPPTAGGAFGMLALAADAIEAAAVLAGGDLRRRRPRVAAVELTESPPIGAGGADLALAVLARAWEAAEVPDVIEFGGEGVSRLPMSERVGAAWLLAEAGVPSLFPSDEMTRAALAALGREHDWRRLEAVADGPATWSVSLASLEPALAPIAPAAGGCAVPAAPRALRAEVGRPVERVLVGPAATLEDLARLAARLSGRRIAAGTEGVVAAGSRAMLDRAVAAGIVATLLEAGLRVVEGEAAPPGSGSGSGLACGVSPSLLGGARGDWRLGGIEAAAAAMLAGALAMPVEGGGTLPEPVPVVSVEPWWPPVVDAAAVGRGAPAEAAWPARGEVLAVLGDDAAADTVLPPGARLEEARGRLHAMAGGLLAGIEPDFAERARRRGGGWLVAGRGFLAGSAAAAAVCLAEAGVWGILARSYAPGSACTLVHAGVIPFVVGGEAPRRGDEVEVAGLPHALLPGHPVAGRNLTSGVALSLGHDLSAREVAILRRGGLVSAAWAGGEERGTTC